MLRIHNAGSAGGHPVTRGLLKRKEETFNQNGAAWDSESHTTLSLIMLSGAALGQSTSPV
jgi:hypothetical protein